MKTLALFLCLTACLGAAVPRLKSMRPRLSYVEAGSPVPAGLTRIGPVRWTGSMRPYIDGGEFLFVEPYTGQALQLGEVVATDVLHMVVYLKPGRVLTSSTSYSRPDKRPVHVLDHWKPLLAVKFIVRVIELREGQEMPAN